MEGKRREGKGNYIQGLEIVTPGAGAWRRALHPGLHMKGSSNGKQSLIYLNNI